MNPKNRHVWCVGVVCIGVLNAKGGHADQFLQKAKEYSAWVTTGAGISTLVPGPAAEAIRKGAVGGTAIGQLIDVGISHWWDPAIEVYPLNPSTIVYAIPDSAIESIADSILMDFQHSSPFTTTLQDLRALDTVSSGFGTAAVNLLFAAVRTFAHTAQGAAAYAQHGPASSHVISAAGYLTADLQQFRAALQAFASYLPPYDGEDYMPVLTSVQYLDFLATGSPPQGEVEVGERILALAGVHMVGNTLANRISTFLLEGDTGNEAAALPLTTSQLMLHGIAAFDLNPFTMQIVRRPIRPPGPRYRLIVLKRQQVSEYNAGIDGSNLQIRFVLHWPGDIAVEIFDVRGHRLSSLQSKGLTAGAHSLVWDIRAPVSRLPAGQYFVRLESAGEQVIQSVTLLR